jgi:antitoxin ParD1/3/4
MSSSIGFRLTPEDDRILREATLPGESRSDTMRRALRLLERDHWLDQFHRDTELLVGEDTNDEPEAW